MSATYENLPDRNIVKKIKLVGITVRIPNELPETMNRCTDNVVGNQKAQNDKHWSIHYRAQMFEQHESD